MKRLRLTLAAACFLILAGCSTDPTARWVQSAGLFDLGVRTTLAAHSAGVIGDGTLRDLDPVVEAANTALDAGYDRLPGGGDAFDRSMDIVEAAILEIERAASAGEAVR